MVGIAGRLSERLSNSLMSVYWAPGVSLTDNHNMLAYYINLAKFTGCGISSGTLLMTTLNTYFKPL